VIETTVSVSNFEGPLGLLLELVDIGKIEITTIAVAAVTGAYLKRVSSMTSLNRDELAQFAELGARLVFIKSSALLPIIEKDDLSPQAELKRLNEELVEYRSMRIAADMLKQRQLNGSHSYSRPLKAKKSSALLPMPQLDITLLAAAFQTALQEAKPAALSYTVSNDYNQAEIALGIMKHVHLTQLPLTELITNCRDRLEIIVTFLAVLELARAGRVWVRQSRIFEEVFLELPHD
jgi:segregation and condensation protein A